MDSATKKFACDIGRGVVVTDAALCDAQASKLDCSAADGALLIILNPFIGLIIFSNGGLIFCIEKIGIDVISPCVGGCDVP